MILAVMSLQQWIDANHLMDDATQTLQFDALHSALSLLQTTQICILLLCSDSALFRQFMAFIGSQSTLRQAAETTLLPRQILDNTQDWYVEAIRAIHRQDLDARSVVSFISSVQQIDEFTHLSYHNPGQYFQHYHAWVDSYLPIFPKKCTIVMFAGEVVPQDRAKAINVFLPIAEQQKKPNSNLHILIVQMQSLFALQEIAPHGHVHQFKMGFIDDSTFDTRMIACIKEQLGIDLSISQFNQIWQAANPDFSEIETGLRQVDAEKLRRNGYDLEFVSYTNPKDMARLADELKQHDQAYVLAKGQLIGLAGLRLSCSFLEQKTQLEMIQDIVSHTSYAHSMQLVHSSHKSRAQSVYFVTSAPTLPESLKALNDMPNVHVLLGWDGSPLDEWIGHIKEEEHALVRQNMSATF